MDEYLRDFVQESEENIRELNAALLDLESDPDDEEAMDRVFRTAHTLKGNCGAMGFTGAEDLAHAIEDRLDDVRAGRLEVTPELMDEIFVAVDDLEAMIDEVRDHGEPRTDPTETVRRLRALGPSDALESPTGDELDDAVETADDPTDPEHNVYHVRIDVETGDGVNNARLVADALEDAFDLLGTDPPRGEIAAGDLEGQFDAIFGTAVGEASIEGALDPIDQVGGAVISDVTDRAETAGETDDGEGEIPDVDEVTDVSADEADDMEVDELLDEFDAYDDIDEMVEQVEDTDDLGDLGEAGTFDDVDVGGGPEPTAGGDDGIDLDDGDVAIDEADAGGHGSDAGSDDQGASEAAPDADSGDPDVGDAGGATDGSTADGTEEVDDASETFQELQEEVDPVGFNELQDELDGLEFDQYDQEEEVGFDELLSEEELEDDSFEALSDDEVDDAVDDMLVEEGSDEGTAGFTTGGASETDVAADETATDATPAESTPADDGETATSPDEAADASPPDETAEPAGADAPAESSAGIGDLTLDDENAEVAGDDVEFGRDDDIEFDEGEAESTAEADSEGAGEFADDLFGGGGGGEPEPSESDAEADATPATEPGTQGTDGERASADPGEAPDPTGAAGPSVSPGDDTEPAVEPAGQPGTEAGTDAASASDVAAETGSEGEADAEGPSVAPADEPESAVEPVDGAGPADDLAVSPAPLEDVEPAVEPVEDRVGGPASADRAAPKAGDEGDEPHTGDGAAAGSGAAGGGTTASAGADDAVESGEEPAEPEGPATPGDESTPETAEATGGSFEASGSDDMAADVDLGTDESLEFGDEESLEFDTADGDAAFEAHDDGAADESGFGSFDEEIEAPDESGFGGFDDVGSPDAGTDSDVEGDDFTAGEGTDAGEPGDDSLSDITFDDGESEPVEDASATTDDVEATGSPGAAEGSVGSTPDEEMDDVEVEEFGAGETADVDEPLGGSLGDAEDVASELEEADLSTDVGAGSSGDLSLGEQFGESTDAGPGGVDVDRPDVGASRTPTETGGPDREQLPDRDVDLDELLPDPPHEAARQEREEGDGVQSIRVDIDQVDRLLNLVEGLVTTRARLRRAVESGESLADIDREIDDLEGLTNDLQDTVMDVRLVPLETTASRIPRTVRDIAREQSKEVDFRMEGEDVEIDRSVLDDIGDPLTHLVRNAVDHGIEPPDEREAAGKDSEGTVELRARRRRGDVVIEVEDDGRGLDPDELREAAVEEGVLDDDEAADLDEEDAYELIFHPGLTTASEVTDVSGRGVGMDVVKSTVEDLDGEVEVESTPGEGTTVRMILPVTVAIDDVLFVEAGGEEFGVPMKAVEEIGRLAELEVVDDGDAVQYGDRQQSLIDLGETLDVRDRGREAGGMLLHLRETAREAALRCDAVRTQQEVVVRPFEDLLGDIPGLGGAAILGEGEVVTILDVETL